MSSVWRVSDIVGAANYLDQYGGPDGASEYCPMGLGSADAGQIDRLMVAAIAAGYGYVIRGV